MSSQKQSVKPIEWREPHLILLDQTRLPHVTEYLTIGDEMTLWDAIKRLAVRGAPAIGVAAAYGVYLGVNRRNVRTIQELKQAAVEVADYLATSRPTAVNLFWALNSMKNVVKGIAEGAGVETGLQTLLKAAKAIHADDEDRCAKLSAYGAALFDSEVKGILTHCNAGALATAGMGTALGVIREVARQQKITVYVDETRPLLQGARLTAWEMAQEGIEYRLIADNMAASMMQQGLIQAVITGADRIAMNGDSANKIGTMPLAICAKYFGVPFYIAAPLSTVDFSIQTGREIPIEERAHEEITTLGGVSTAPTGTLTRNPAFDVVPNELIASIITEVGIITPPFEEGLRNAKQFNRTTF
ncbi:MAG: S-methyl-5-thioribose-1-phosphate isomerase [Candidatus Sumerlaeia bacterium]|nr:S-methyl-5-thioribose-1-phosphate isomerase [Candidatus Sumerlaeia bacterium]